METIRALLMSVDFLVQVLMRYDGECGSYVILCFVILFSLFVCIKDRRKADAWFYNYLSWRPFEFPKRLRCKEAFVCQLPG